MKGKCMFLKEDQDMLKSLVELGATGRFSGKRNVNLDIFIRSLMRSNPEKFHDTKHEPTPNKDSVVPK